MKPLVIFGTGKIAEVLLYFFRNHSDREVVACTVDKQYMPGEEWPCRNTRSPPCFSLGAWKK